MTPGRGPNPGNSRQARNDIVAVAVSLAVAYLPILLSSPGRVGADTKTYLYLDPGRLLREASSMWDSGRALGTVTHQNIGYLWPMGPFYWLLEFIGSPDWLAQRLWLATLLATAGLGVRYLLRTIGWRGPGLLLAMLAYQLSPYLLDYSARISVVLLPWAGLPWLIAFTIRSARSGGWRHPALFALTVLTVGSVNATGLVLVGIGPVLWLLHAAAVERSISATRAFTTALRIAVLSIGVSLWSLAGLLVQAGYSLPITRYTETYEVVASASTAPEILRGLGYWFFYGNDKFGAWIEPSVDYTQGLWLVFVSFGLVVLAIAMAALLRWRHRSFFLLLLVVGALVAIGAHPFDNPSPLGGLFKSFTAGDLGLALRSTPRAVPLVALASAVLLAAGVNALHERIPAAGRTLGLLALVAVVLNNPAMWKIRMLEQNLQRPEDIPEYWIEATAALDEVNVETRVWELPGSDFASYRWGNTVDPITPGLIERDYLARELVPFGSAPSAALLGAADRRLQEDTLDPDSLAPLARLMSVGDVIHRADLTFERFRTPRPPETAALLGRAAGLEEAASWGVPAPNVAGPAQTMIDEIHLARPTDIAHPAPVTRFEVTDPLPLVRTRSLDAATVLAGDADGIVAAAEAEVLDPARPLFFAADVLAEPGLFERILAEPAEIIVTDSNRRRARRWGTLREGVGYTEQAGETPLVFDPTDNRLAVFAGRDDDIRTVSEHRGPLAVQATAYGNPVTYSNDDRPVLAVDGSLETAWVVAAFDEARGERLRISLNEPTLLPRMRLVQPLGPANRRITEVIVHVDGSHSITAGLDERSSSPAGQSIELGLPASVIEIEISDTDMPRRATYPGVDPVGFAEVDLGLGPVTEVIRAPRALLDRLGPELAGHSLTVVLTRERSNPAEPVRSDPESRMLRSLALPGARTVTVTGSARLSAAAPESLIDELLGFGTSGSGGAREVSAVSSGYLPGDLASRASAVLDGDSSTAWTSRFGPQAGQWLEIRPAPSPTGIETPREPGAHHPSALEIDLVADSLHSLPEAFRVLIDGVDKGVFELGATTEAGSLVSVSIQLPETPRRAGSPTIRLVLAEVAEKLTRDWYSNTFVALPVAIAEVRLNPGRSLQPTAVDPSASFDSGCRDDLLSVDDVAVEVRVTGSVADALARRELRLEGCDEAVLAGGESLISTSPGAVTGLDIDQLVLSSPRPMAAGAGSGAVTVQHHSDTRLSVTVPSSRQDRWLVLGQSHNRGWQATLDGRNLGEPILIDGFANGWLVPAGPEADVSLTWTPQRHVDRALWLSAILVIVTVALAWRGRGDQDPARPWADLGPESPLLAWPYLQPDPRPVASTRSWVVAALLVAGLALLNLPQWPALALLLGAATAATLRRRRFSSLLGLAGAVSLGIAALYVMVEQRRFRHPPDFVWPQQFDEVHILGVLAVLWLLAEYLRDAIASRGAVRIPLGSCDAPAEP